MSLPITLAAFSTLVVAIPAFAFRRRFLLNPAFYVLIIVSGSVLLKTLYVSLVRHQPLPVGHDAIYIDAASPDFLIPGAWLALVAAVAYTGGFLMIGSRTLAPWMPFRLRETALPRSAPRNVLVLTGLSIGAFVLYLVASDTSFFQLPFSAKRFAPENIDVSSRFEYAPYYLFKIALTGGSIACVAALALFRSRDPVYRGLFALVFLFALTLSHFASLRLFILLVILQVVLLLIHFRAHRELRFVSLFVFLTAGSFLLITVIDRAPPREAMEMVQRAVTDPDVPAGPEEAGPIAADDIVDRPVPATSAPTPRPARAELDEADDPKPVVGLAARLASAGFEGRYFMDVSKLAHIARHFPAREPFLRGGGVIGLWSPSTSADEASALPSINRYLAQQVFREPRNNIPPGFAGELYINFAGPGLFLGFLILGGAHRLLGNHLLLSQTPGLAAACLVLVIPSTTVVLLNSGLLSAVSRSAIDIGVLLLVWQASFERERRRLPA